MPKTKKSQKARGQGTAGPSRKSNGTWAKGVSGNPSGGVKQYAARVRKAIRDCLEATNDEQKTNLDMLIASVLKDAMDGNMHAAKLILDRVCPAGIEADINVTGITGGQVRSTFDALRRTAIASGTLNPEVN